MTSACVVNREHGTRVQQRMRLASLFLFLALLTASCHAQRCGTYEFECIVVVRPHARDSTVLSGLHITLLDTSGLPAFLYGPAFNHFVANTDRNGPYPVHRRTWRANGQRTFPFALDNYVLVIPCIDLTGYSVLVEHERPVGSYLTRYERTVVPLVATDAYPLGCHDQDVVYPALVGRPPYAPVDIELRPHR
jgi:hypothetical protein